MCLQILESELDRLSLSLSAKTTIDTDITLDRMAVISQKQTSLFSSNQLFKKLKIINKI